MSLISARASGFAPTPGGLGPWLAGAIQRFECYRRARRERHQLLGLNERELRDIGITRVDAWREAERPLWSGCSAGRLSP